MLGREAARRAHQRAPVERLGQSGQRGSGEQGSGLLVVLEQVLAMLELLEKVEGLLAEMGQLTARHYFPAASLAAAFTARLLSRTRARDSGSTMSATDFSEPSSP